MIVDAFEEGGGNDDIDDREMDEDDCAEDEGENPCGSLEVDSLVDAPAAAPATSSDDNDDDTSGYRACES